MTRVPGGVWEVYFVQKLAWQSFGPPTARTIPAQGGRRARGHRDSCDIGARPVAGDLLRPKAAQSQGSAPRVGGVQ